MFTSAPFSIAKFLLLRTLYKRILEKKSEDETIECPSADLLIVIRDGGICEQSTVK
jgi:hypothetical protein